MPLYTPYQYSGYYQPQYQRPIQAPPQQNYMQSANMNQVQNGGFVIVPHENDVITYPVAPGTSVTFKIENAPFCYTKTMGFSQLEAPVIEKFRLVKEEIDTPRDASAESTGYATKAELSALAGVVKDVDGLIADIRKDVNALKERKDVNDGKPDA